MNDTIGPLFAIGPPLVIGTIFSILCTIRYLTEPDLRTHYSYIVSKIKEEAVFFFISS
jgi:hypothetical protein